LWKYLPYINPYEGIQEKRCKQISQMFSANEIHEGGLVFDEIEIRKGLVYLTSTGRIIGLVDGNITEKQVDQFSSIQLEKKLATKILQVFFVSSNGKICCPPGIFSKQLNHRQLCF
jgi:hypothetical protein